MPAPCRTIVDMTQTELLARRVNRTINAVGYIALFLVANLVAFAVVAAVR